MEIIIVLSFYFIIYIYIYIYNNCGYLFDLNLMEMSCVYFGKFLLFFL